MERRTLALSLACGALGLALALDVGKPVRGGAAAAVERRDCSLASGDVNGTGPEDGPEIGDAIAILNHLFLGGQKPLALCVRKGPLPATGQSGRCWGSLEPTDCPSSYFPGQDGYFGSGCPREERFVDNADGTVTDGCTNLVWQKKPVDVNGDGRLDGGDAVTWQEALQLTDRLVLCEDGCFVTDPRQAEAHGGAKRGDWRLPNAFELFTLLDFGRSTGVDSDLFPIPDGGPHWYWTSTTYPIPECCTDHAVVVLFGSFWAPTSPYRGPVSWGLKQKHGDDWPQGRHMFRAVRTADPSD